MINVEFCDRYSYHPSIKELYKDLLNPINPLKVRSVILYGSSASGEMGFCIHNGEVEVYSDYDLLLIAEGRGDKAYQKKISKLYSFLEQKYPQKFPHIEFIYTEMKGLISFLKRRPDIGFMFKNSGVTIFGEDMISLIPPVSLEDLSPTFKIDSLLGKLWLLMLYFPKELLLNSSISIQSLRKSGYVISKLYLHLILWILAVEGILLPTYRTRIDYFKIYFNDLKASKFFTLDSEFLEECYIGKTKIIFKRDIATLWLKVIEQHLLSKEYIVSLLGLSKKGHNVIFSTMADMPTPDDSFQRKFYNFYLLITKLQPFRMKDAFNWFFSSKYCLMFDFLFNMNAALYYFLKGEYDEAMLSIRNSHIFLKKLILNKSGIEELKTNDFSQKWLLFRELAADFRYTYFPSLRYIREKFNL